MNRCDQITEKEYSITIQPERDRVNDSAWYAFRIDSTHQTDVNVSLNYVGGTHRYDPKISRDGINWRAAPELVSRRHPLGTAVELRIPLDGEPIWIAGQELIDNDCVDHWSDTMAEMPHVRRSLIGESVQGRPLHRLDITESDEPDYVFIITRQHPPEVSGAIGMMHFVESIASDSELSKKFRERYSAVVVPLVNPDGVAQGNWRCNANDVAITYEFGDETDRATIRSIATGAAEQMMRLLVDLPDNRHKTQRMASAEAELNR